MVVLLGCFSVIEFSLFDLEWMILWLILYRIVIGLG